MPTPQQQQQQQPTAEKSVQTHDSTGSATLLVSNNAVSHFHPENTATEVANTLVSMATGRQRPTNVKQLVSSERHRLVINRSSSPCRSVECRRCSAFHAVANSRARRLYDIARRAHRHGAGQSS